MALISRAGNSAYDIQRAVGGKAHDDAFAVALGIGMRNSPLFPVMR